ncbi:hypothetical protein ACN3E9_13515 [Vibrio pectenicida]|uniref:hypothetical protein n=1 Tax=Vibrio pectenicida TaxID=62763 RepID=UPI003B9974BD
MSVIAISATVLGPNEAYLYARIGQIKQVHPSHDKVSVDFEGNPAGEPVWASIGRAFTRAQINLAIDNQLACKIEFMNTDPSLPILTDVYFSFLEQKSLIIKAEKIILEGTKEVTLKSKNTSTHYDGRSGRVTTKADYITSQAERSNKIQGKKIDLN